MKNNNKNTLEFLILQQKLPGAGKEYHDNAVKLMDEITSGAFTLRRDKRAIVFKCSVFKRTLFKL